VTQEGYLANGTHAVLHLPGDSHHVGRTGLVIVPPFGFEDVSSYRGLRGWADELAGTGVAVLRIELLGTGDSLGDPGDPGLVASWAESIGMATDVLRRVAHCQRVAVLGIDLGGLVAWRAAAHGAGIDELALWAVPAQGRTLLRRIRAFAMVQGSAPPMPQDDGSLWFYGYPMAATTRADLQATDVTTIPLPPRVRRALVLGPDRMQPDPRLLGALRAAGTDVTVGSGDGYAGLVENPQTAVAPPEVLQTLQTWLDAGRDAGAVVGTDHDSATEAEWRSCGQPLPGVTEQAVDLATAEGRLAAVVSRPERPDYLTMVLLNAGGTRRTGPNRLWVRAARQASSKDIPAVRVDLLGLGDSDGPFAWTGGDAAFYSENYLGQVTAILDRLVEQGLPDRFLLVGLCSGSYWAFRCGQVDQRVVGVVMLNPRALVWEPWRTEVEATRDLARLRRASTWLRILTGKASWQHGRDVLQATLRRALRSRTVREHRRVSRSAREAGGDALDLALDRLRDNGTDATLVFSRAEPLLLDLQRDDRLADLSRWPNLELRLLDGPPDVHTLPPPELQTLVLGIIDDVTGRLRRQVGSSSEHVEPPDVAPRSAAVHGTSVLGGERVDQVEAGGTEPT
jgi:dienelactone hydrolase